MPFTASGVIDRVDLVPFDAQGEQWHDEEGSNQVAPSGCSDLAGNQGAWSLSGI